MIKPILFFLTLATISIIWSTIEADSFHNVTKDIDIVVSMLFTAAVLILFL